MYFHHKGSLSLLNILVQNAQRGSFSSSRMLPTVQGTPLSHPLQARSSF